MNEKQFLQDIETENVTIVRSRCPMSTYVGTCRDFEFYKRCVQCEFMVVKTYEPMKYMCGWNEYITKFIKEKDFTESDNGDGSIPWSDYTKVIKCYHCDSEIVSHSGMSMFGYGDVLRCKKCGTVHFYLRNNGKPNYEPVFAVPMIIEKFDKLVE